MKIITLSWNHPLDDNELWEAEQTMGILAQAVTNRVTALAGNFRNQNLDPTAEFQHAYNGMVRPKLSPMGSDLHLTSSRLFGTTSTALVCLHQPRSLSFN